MSNETTALVPAEPATTLIPVSDLLWTSSGFGHLQRLALMFSKSQLIPADLRGRVEDVTIALSMARRMDEDPLTVLQSIYLIKGKPGWSAQYVIGRANRSGILRGRINWRIEGSGDALKVTAYATLAASGDEISYAVTMQMAKLDGWTRNEKYRSMPELMLRYRSAVLLVRFYLPEVMLGLPAAEEVETYAEVITSVPGTRSGVAVQQQAPQTTPAVVSAADHGCVGDPPDFSEMARKLAEERTHTTTEPGGSAPAAGGAATSPVVLSAGTQTQAASGVEHPPAPPQGSVTPQDDGGSPPAKAPRTRRPNRSTVVARVEALRDELGDQVYYDLREVLDIPPNATPDTLEYEALLGLGVALGKEHDRRAAARQPPQDDPLPPEAGTADPQASDAPTSPTTQPRGTDERTRLIADIQEVEADMGVEQVTEERHDAGIGPTSDDLRAASTQQLRSYHTQISSGGAR